MKRNQAIYKPCADIKRTYPDTEISPELIKLIATNYDTLPSFESTVFQDKFIKHYSLERNELLKCRWKQYRENIAEIVTSPFQFPKISDLHFYNNTIRFMPSISITNIKDWRMKLKPGPGVDWRGQMPIPHELLMKRGISKKEDIKHVTKKDTKNKILEEKDDYNLKEGKEKDEQEKGKMPLSKSGKIK